jgi:hypothetical protein
VFQAANVLEGMGFENEARVCRSAASGYGAAKGAAAKAKQMGKSMKKGATNMKKWMSSQIPAKFKSKSADVEVKDEDVLTEEQQEIRDKCMWPGKFSICEMWKNPGWKGDAEKDSKFINLDNGDYAAPRHLCEAVEHVIDAKNENFGEGGDGQSKIKCMKMRLGHFISSIYSISNFV